MLGPAGLWKALFKLFLSDRDHSALAVEQDRPRTGRTLIESECVSHGENPFKPIDVLQTRERHGASRRYPEATNRRLAQNGTCFRRNPG